MSVTVTSISAIISLPSLLDSTNQISILILGLSDFGFFFFARPTKIPIPKPKRNVIVAETKMGIKTSNAIFTEPACEL
jgi:hypothetical protein